MPASLGNPSDEQLKSAISEAVACNETLHSRIVLQDNGLAFYEKAESLYQVCSVDRNWTELVAEFPLRPLDIFNGEMIRFYILRGGGDLQILIIGHHLAGDGLSFVFLVEDIMRALNGESIQYKPLRVLDARELPKGSGMSFFAKMYLRRLNQRWRKSGTVFNKADYRRLLDGYAKAYNGHVWEHTLSKEETGKLIQYAKSLGISVNSLLVTALLKAYEEAAAAGIAVSVRKPDYRGMANWASGIAIEYHYDTRIDFAANAKAVQKKLYKRLHNKRKKHIAVHFIGMMDGSLLDSVYMAKYLGFSHPISKKIAVLMSYADNIRDLGLSNLTRAAIPASYGPYSLQGMGFVPPVLPYCRRTIGIITFDNTMSITMNTAAEDKTKEHAFFTRTVRYICSLEKE